ncbi:MAG: hypothetical protein OK455_09640 [Thaumarchaeota archaeon]|nr:hypothetical protein [Nitrososphaerota archaeon]
MPSLAIFVHIPFDTGTFIGDDLLKSGLLYSLKEEFHEKEASVERKPITFFTDEIDASEDGSQFSKVPVNIPLPGLSPYQGDLGTKSRITLESSDINLFESGIGITHLRFRVDLDDLKPALIYDAYEEITKLLVPIDRRHVRSDSLISREIRKTVEKTISLAREEARTHGKTARGEWDPVVYIYPMFSLGPGKSFDQVEDFLCLLYHGRDRSQMTPEKLASTKASNFIITTEGYFYTEWDAAMTGGTGVTEQTAESNERILEVASYAYCSMRAVDQYLSKRIEELLEGEKTKEPNFGELNVKLAEIRKIRLETELILDIYRNLRMVLRGSTARILEPVMVKWRLERLESSIDGKLSLLTSINNDAADTIERGLDHRLNGILFSLQWIGYSIAVLIVLLPFLGAALDMNVPMSITSTDPVISGLGQVVELLTHRSGNLGVAILVVAFTGGLTYLLQERQWRIISEKENRAARAKDSPRKR